MDSLPPVQRTLLRQQVFFPISLLLFVGTVLVCSFVAHPSPAEINDQFTTIVSPSKAFIGLFWLVIFVLEIGQALLLLGVKGADSIAMLTSGVGLRLAIINIVMAIWTATWTFKQFLASEIALFVVLVLAASIAITLRPHAKPRLKPIEFLVVHAPVRMILAVLCSVDVWQNGLLALGYYKAPGHKWEDAHSTHVWVTFGVVMAVYLLTAVEVFILQDTVWAISAIFLSVGVAVHGEGKPVQVFVAYIFGAVAVFVALLSSLGWALMKKDREGAVRLEDEPDEALAPAAIGGEA